MADKYGGPINKHQQLAQTGHAEGYATGGTVHHSSGGGHMSKHEHHHGHHHGHGKHGHRGPHEHHTDPGTGHTGHAGHSGSVHSLVHEGKNTPEHVVGMRTEHIETGGGHDGHKGVGGHSTGSTRNRI